MAIVTSSVEAGWQRGQPPTQALVFAPFLVGSLLFLAMALTTLGIWKNGQFGLAFLPPPYRDSETGRPERTCRPRARVQSQATRQGAPGHPPAPWCSGRSGAPRQAFRRNLAQLWRTVSHGLWATAAVQAWPSPATDVPVFSSFRRAVSI